MGDVMQRIAMALEFDGHGLCGWQRQDNGPTVQEHLESALARIEGTRVCCHAAGRTDAGVHAEAMPAHADVSADRFSRTPKAYVHGVNQHLPGQIRVIGVCGVCADFHARFDCRERVYLTGRHDFSSFRATGCQASSPIRELREVRIERQGECVLIHFRADAFLYHMVRNLVGSLVQVGVGKWSPEQMEEVLLARDRKQAADTAPAHGLYFTHAVYDDFDSREIASA